MGWLGLTKMTNHVLHKHLIQSHTYAKKTAGLPVSGSGLHTSDVSFFKNLLSLSHWRHGYFGWKMFQARGHFLFWVLMWNQRILPPGGSDLTESSSGFRRFPTRVLSSSCGLVCPPVGWGVGEMSCSEAQDFEHLILRFCFLHRGGCTGKWCFRALPGKADPGVGSVTSLSVLALKTHT